MLRRQVSAQAVAAVVVLVLAVVQLTYWRLLVYRAPVRPRVGGGGGAGPGAPPGAFGLKAVQVDTLAGDQPGYVDGPAWKARFYAPAALALEPGGALLVADSRNHRIRRVAPNGDVSTIAGGGIPEGAGGESEGPALEALLRYPSGLAVGRDGALYIADTGNHRICRVAGGVLHRFAGGDGSLPAPGPLAVDRDGTLWALDTHDLRIRRIDAKGGARVSPAPPEIAARLGETSARPQGALLAAWDDAGAEPLASAYPVGRRAPGWSALGLPPIYGDLDYGAVMLAVSGRPPLLLAGRRPTPLGTLPTDGPGDRATFAVPAAVVLGADGTAYVAEYEAHRIRRLRLPQWLLDGSLSAPVRGRWGNRRGS